MKSLLQARRIKEDSALCKIEQVRPKHATPHSFWFLFSRNCGSLCCLPLPPSDFLRLMPSFSIAKSLGRLASWLHCLSIHHVLQGLFVGSVGAAHNASELRSHGVTHVLVAARSLTPAHPDAFTYMHIDGAGACSLCLQRGSQRVWHLCSRHTM